MKHMHELGDTDLMILFQQGDVNAFELLFEKYRRPLFNFISRMLNSRRDAAEDLLQEVFVKVAGAKEFYEPRAKFSTWMFMIARNHCLNHLRSRRYLQSQATVSLDADTGCGNGTTLIDVIPGDAPSPLETVTGKDMEAFLDICISQLPDAYKEVFLLRAVEGLPHQEVADILDMNPATVRTNYLRARQMLQEQLRGYFNQEPHKPSKEEEKHEL